jgi:hypothetical protein
MTPPGRPTQTESLVYRNELTGELRKLDHALEAGIQNVMTYEEDLEVIATYGIQDPAGVDGRWRLGAA